MTSIVFHAGMPKAGSTTIQDWLAANLPFLGEHRVRCLRIMRPDRAGPIELRDASSTSAVSQFVANDVESRPGVVAEICAKLAAAADTAADDDVLVVSNESYEVLFNAGGQEASLQALDELAGRHPFRLVYYVRPQHAWLESAWLQWGFRNPAPPDAWIRKQRRRVDYLETLHTVRAAAPQLAFEIRPFRTDLLDGGHVVSDFARNFLGIHDLPPEEARERWSNRSLPMDAAMVLRHAPNGMFWANQNDNKLFYPLKRIILEWDVPCSDVQARSRAVLQRYAWATFESGNRRLIDELGWDTDHFVAAPPEPAGAEAAATADAALGELNALWESPATAAERGLLFAALERLVAAAVAS